MKTSNKILLGTFIGILLLTTTINLIVYAKYKQGKYEPFVREESKLAAVTLPASKYVSVTGLCSVELLNSTAPRYEVQVGKEKAIAYRMVGDTIIIQGNTLTNDQLEHGECNYQSLKLFLPAATQVNFTHAGVEIKGSGDSTQAPSFNIQLDKHTYLKMEKRSDDYTYINQLRLSGNNSSIDLHDRLIIKDMSLKLVNDCRFDGKKAAIASLALDVDNSTDMTLSGFSYNNIK